ncbi:hypothetical protein NPA07_02355 [Mycoplasmopsis caviae]|uniref:HEAT repeat domain-containing protein n=1 Tax=Mycoplasmopsis caviae TaxID=55603 RepID=A0A3P8MD99_9BACT|nr:hypothetical protein [Mycoplasmopsis caviae]UUD35693.1 hypothetical protein NPA07_02355 [Mycoplasmopsis caviae]VDR41560.1 Uncharacterised protein [Mycoplasmopsis caviae]
MKPVENKKQWLSRGYIDGEDIAEFENKSKDELLKLLNHEYAWVRSSVAYNLSPMDEESVDALLKRLCIEDKLYTKIAICETLETGNIFTAKKMVEFLGKIGRNQISEIPKYVSLKKLYPTPRDIIAKSLAKMHPSILPILLETLKLGTSEQKLEVIDSIGSICFNKKELANEKLLNELIDIYDKNINNKIFVWKFIILLSAFNFEASKQILKTYLNSKDILAKEASRSLKLLEESDN